MSGDVFSWNGGTGAFSDPSQWTDETTPGNTGVVAPGAQDSANFTKGGSVSGSGSVAALALDSDVTLLSGASITTGNLDLSGVVSFEANASLSVTDDGTVTNLVGLLTLDQGASLAFSGAGSFFDVGLGTPNTGELDINQAQVSGTELDEATSGEQPPIHEQGMIGGEAKIANGCAFAEGACSDFYRRRPIDMAPPHPAHWHPSLALY